VGEGSVKRRSHRMHTCVGMAEEEGIGCWVAGMAEPVNKEATARDELMRGRRRSRHRRRLAALVAAPAAALRPGQPRPTPMPPGAVHRNAATVWHARDAAGVAGESRGSGVE
jgi:hypothetical protein